MQQKSMLQVPAADRNWVSQKDAINDRLINNCVSTTLSEVRRLFRPSQGGSIVDFWSSLSSQYARCSVSEFVSRVEQESTERLDLALDLFDASKTAGTLA